MIKNTKQYTITKNKLEEFKITLNSLIEKKDTDLLSELNYNAIKSQVLEFEELLRDYECLKTGFINVKRDDSFFDIGDILIKSRIALKLTQKQLAERLNMPEQQVQRYEHTDYESASLSTVFEVMDALELKITIGKLKLDNIHHCDFTNYLKPEGMTDDSINKIEERVRQDKSLFKIA